MFTYFKKIAVIGLTSLLLACSGSNTPEQVARAFTEETFKGNAEAVINMTYFDSANEGDKELFTGKLKALVLERAEQAQQQGGVESIHTEPAKFSDDQKRAIVEVQITFKKGKSETDQIKLIQTHDGWKVNL